MRNAYWRHADTLFDHYHFFSPRARAGSYASQRDTFYASTSSRYGIPSPPRERFISANCRHWMIKRYCSRLTFWPRGVSLSLSLVSSIVQEGTSSPLRVGISSRANSRGFLHFSFFFKKLNHIPIRFERLGWEIFLEASTTIIPKKKTKNERTYIPKGAKNR